MAYFVVLGIVDIRLERPMKPDKELIGARTSLLVLSVLAREASYGYQIVSSINDEAEGLFT